MFTCHPISLFLYILSCRCFEDVWKTGFMLQEDLKIEREIVDVPEEQLQHVHESGKHITLLLSGYQKRSHRGNRFPIDLFQFARYKIERFPVSTVSPPQTITQRDERQLSQSIRTSSVVRVVNACFLSNNASGAKKMKTDSYHPNNYFRIL